MAFDLSTLLSPEGVFGGAGTAVLGFIGGHIKSHKGKFAAMEREIAECRRRDADVVVLKAGMRILVGKVRRDHPDSIELQMFGDLMSRRLGPAPATEIEFDELLRQIDEAAEDHDERDA